MKSTLTTLARRLATCAGGVLLSNQAHQTLLTTRAKAIAQLVQAQPPLSPGLTGIVFSKDRALQIHTLLHSYSQLVKHPAPLIILYNASTPAHAAAYAQVEATFRKAPMPVRFVQEDKPFNQLLPEVLESIPTRNLFFLVDDIILIRPWDMHLAADINPLTTVLCPRLSPSITTSYTMGGVKAHQPTFHSLKGEPTLRTFRFTEGTQEWAYPCSVDGNIFSTAEIKVLASLATYKAPNSFEAALHQFADIFMSREGLCYTESKLLNLPLNKVQTEVANLAASVTPAFLLAQYNQGLMLETTPFRTHTPTSTHEDHPVTFTRRPS
ncbi:MAG: hypothetical protein WAZ18_03850 [Alphaproteobacteria bacterium]